MNLLYIHPDDHAEKAVRKKDKKSLMNWIH